MKTKLFFLEIFENGRRSEEEAFENNLQGDMERLFTGRWNRQSKQAEKLAGQLDSLSADHLFNAYKNVWVPFLKNMQDEDRGAAVIMAAIRGKIGVLKELLKSGMVSENARGLALIHAVASNFPNSLEMVRAILNSGPIEEGGLLRDRDEKIRNNEDVSLSLECSMRSHAILEAARKENVPMIEALLEGVNLLDFDLSMIGSLEEAINKNNVPMYEVLLNHDCYTDEVHSHFMEQMEELTRVDMLERFYPEEYRGIKAILAAMNVGIDRLKEELGAVEISERVRGCILIEAAACDSADSPDMVRAILASGPIDEGELFDDRDDKIENEQPLGIDLDLSMRSKAILAAAQKGNAAVIEALVEGVRFLDYDNYILKALRISIEQNNIPMYRALISHDCYPDGMYREFIEKMEDLGRNEMIEVCYP